MGYLETQIQNTYQGPQPEHYYRSIDDGIDFTTLSTEELNSYINFVKQFHPSISLNFTSEIFATSINFLDIKITLRDISLYSSVYYKPTDNHSYLTYLTSSHPKSCKRSIPYSQMFRLRRLCQDDSDFQSECARMRDFFLLMWLSYGHFNVSPLLWLHQIVQATLKVKRL